MHTFSVDLGTSKFSLNVSVAVCPSDLANAIISSPQVDTILDGAIGDAKFPLYGDDSDPQPIWAEDAAKFFLSHGREKLQEWLIDRSDSYDRLEDAVALVRKAAGMDTLVDAMIDCLKDIFPSEKTARLRNMVEKRLHERLSAAIESADDTTPFDMISAKTQVLLSYIPGISADLSVEDYQSKFVGDVYGPGSMLLDEAAIAFFKLANLSKKEFVNYVRVSKGVNLDMRRSTRIAESYGNIEAHRALLWINFDWETDPTKPKHLKASEAWEILEHATYGGVPCLTVSVPLKWLIDRDPDAPFKIEPSSGVDGKICGQIGMHDFVQGSGHVRTNKNPIEIPAGSLGDWRVSELTGKGFDSVYDFALSYYQAGRFEDLPKPEPMPELEEAPLPRF